MNQTDIYRIKKVDKPILLNLKKDKTKKKDKIIWSEFSIFVFIKKSKNLKNRSILILLKKLIFSLPSYEREYCGKIVLYFQKRLNNLYNSISSKLVEMEIDLKDTFGFFGKIAGELRYYSKDINSLHPIFSEWDQSDSFLFVNLQRKNIFIAREILKQDAFLYNESALFNLCKISNYIIRKSGDEDEFEIITRNPNVIQSINSIWDKLKKNDFNINETF